MLFLAGFLCPSTINQKRANPNPTAIVEDTHSLPAGLAVEYLEISDDSLRTALQQAKGELTLQSRQGT